MAGKHNSIDWYIDSEATSHMTNSEEFLANRNNVCNKQIVVANNSKLSVLCCGGTDMYFKMDQYERKVVVKNVEHVPNLCANLISEVFNKFINFKNGIVYQKTRLYTPELNGVAERMNRENIWSFPNVFK